MTRVTRPSFLLLTLAIATCLAGCGERIGADQVRAWVSAGDHERLRDAVRNGKVDANVRADAAAALVSGGQVAHLQWAVASLPLDDRNAIVPLIAARVGAPLSSAPGSPELTARHAREALFLLRQQVTTPAARSAVDKLLFPSLEATLKRPCDAGAKPDKGTGELVVVLPTDCPGGFRYGIGAMLVDVGDPALPIVQRVLDDATAPFAVAVEVLAKIGDADGKAKGGAALAKRARALPDVPDPLWDALATLGGQDARAFVVEKVRAGGAVAEKASAASLKFRRDPELLAPALELAGDRAASPKVRADMMQLARKIAGPDARKGLVALVAREPDPSVRWQLVDAALPLSASESLIELLEALPANATVSRAELQQHLVDPMGKMGWEVRAGLFKAMETKTASALAKLIAVWTLEASNWKSDGEHVAKLAKHPGAVRGIPGVTVGREATRVAAKLTSSGM